MALLTVTEPATAVSVSDIGAVTIGMTGAPDIPAAPECTWAMVGAPRLRQVISKDTWFPLMRSSSTAVPRGSPIADRLAMVRSLPPLRSASR